jgi:hypothetical protein
MSEDGNRHFMWPVGLETEFEVGVRAQVETFDEDKHFQRLGIDVARNHAASWMIGRTG